MINFKPLNDNVLILPIAETISSFLEIPETVEKSIKNARVLAVGSKVKDVKVDDVVLLPYYGAIEITLDGEKYKLVHEEDIVAIVY